MSKFDPALLLVNLYHEARCHAEKLALCLDRDDLDELERREDLLQELASDVASELSGIQWRIYELKELKEQKDEG